MTVMVTAFFGYLIPKLYGHTFQVKSLYVSAAFLVLSLVYPISLKVIYKVWMVIGGVLGWVNSKVILSLIFFLVISPFALIMKILGKDPMNRKITNKEKSYKLIPEEKKIDLNVPY